MFEVPKRSKYHAHERLKCQNVTNTMQNGRQTWPNVANTMQNAKLPCQNGPKCSKYHAKWQVLVPNGCKYKAHDTRKESKKNPKPEAKKYQKLFYTPFIVYWTSISNAIPCRGVNSSPACRMPKRPSWPMPPKAARPRPQYVRTKMGRWWEDDWKIGV